MHVVRNFKMASHLRSHPRMNEDLTGESKSQYHSLRFFYAYEFHFADAMDLLEEGEKQ